MLRGFPIEAILHFRLENLWLLLPIGAGLALLFLYFWARQDRAKDFVRIAERGLNAEKPVGPAAAFWETLTTVERAMLIVRPLVAALLMVLALLMALTFAALSLLALVAPLALLTFAWQFSLAGLFGVFTWRLARACRQDWQEWRAAHTPAENTATTQGAGSDREWHLSPRKHL